MLPSDDGEDGLGVAVDMGTDLLRVIPTKRSASPLDDLDARVRETRYGFGRERRLRLVFTGRTTPTWLRRAVARRRDAQLIEAGDLVGT